MARRVGRGTVVDLELAPRTRGRGLPRGTTFTPAPGLTRRGRGVGFTPAGASKGKRGGGAVATNAPGGLGPRSRGK